MLGSISWEQVALLSRILVGVEYDYDDVEWEEPQGDTQVGQVPRDRAGVSPASLFESAQRGHLKGHLFPNWEHGILER